MQRPTDYDLELEQIRRDVAAYEGARASTSAADAEVARRVAYGLYRRAALTGDDAQCTIAEAAINETIRRHGTWPDLCLLKADLDLKRHRLAAVQRDLQIVPGLIDCPAGKALQADLDLQRGRYAAARQGYERLIEAHRTWDALARMAHLTAVMGDTYNAEQLYLEAADRITAKEMRSYAWVELQLGLLAFAHGRHDRARIHYQQADAAYTGYWLVQRHVAELLVAQREYDRAIALYEAILARTTRPDLQQALGDLYVRMGKPDLAGLWHARALAGYLESVRKGQVQYLHHLADFYAEVRRDGTRAVYWARRDVAMRPNFTTQATLARALYLHGELDQALGAIRQALSSGAQDAQLFYLAGLIHQAAGRAAEGQRLLHDAAGINPRYQDFHVHH